ncbi:MAG: copper resistance protein CopC [Nitrospirae bacterium]|nr:copper resistance protein CopC [Nitrospirota bacterium]
MNRNVSAIMWGLGVGLWLGLTSGHAWAHAFPDHSEPHVGAEVTSAPSTVRIWFDGRLEPLFSTIHVMDHQGRRVDTGPGGVDPDDPTLLTTAMPPVPPGVYTVAWDVVSVDGHHTEGKFNFTILGGS